MATAELLLCPSCPDQTGSVNPEECFRTSLSEFFAFQHITSGGDKCYFRTYPLLCGQQESCQLKDNFRDKGPGLVSEIGSVLQHVKCIA